MTRAELATAIVNLAEDEKLSLLEELWDSLDHTGPSPKWHEVELDSRLDAQISEPMPTWSDVKARVLGVK